MSNEYSDFSPLVDVIIPTFNNVSSLLKTLRSLEHQSEKQFLIHICIDGSSVETRHELNTEHFSLHFLIHSHPNDEHRGRNATRNLALEHLVSTYVITVDSDAEVNSTFIEEHLKVVDENTISVGIFTYTNIHQNLWAMYLQHRGNSKYSHLEEIPYYYFKTGNVCFPKRFFVELDGQDSSMKSYGGGDTEFSIRIQSRYSPKYVCNQKAIASSEMDKSLSFALDQFFEFGAVNLRYILAKYPNERKIFAVNTLIYNSFFSLILRFPFKKNFTPIVSFLPTKLSLKLIHICVASQIVKGYFSK
jgi:glycosyltransferase involved in cell wall biosynthesis